MKKISVLLLAMVLLSGSLSAQRTLTTSSIKTEARLVWFGIDYSFVKLRGEYEAPGNPLYKTPERIVQDYFEKWNTVVVSEPAKFNIKKAFEKQVVENDVMVVEKRNKKVDASTLVSMNQNKITKEQIAAAIKEYHSMTNKEGLGCVFVAECLDNIDKVGSYYVTFFDIATNEVLACERVMGKPNGAKLESYWAVSVADALKDAHALYKTWK